MKAPSAHYRRRTRPLRPDALISAGSRLAMAVLKTRLAARPRGVPHSLFVGVTARCDLACRHCKYAPARGSARPAELPRRTLHRLIGQAAAAGIPRLVLFGGEPLLYRGLEKAVSAAARLGLFTELDTNGQALDQARAEKLAAAGLAAAMVSLHSADRKRHDALSGPGSFDRAAAAIAAARKAGLIVYVSSCIFSDALSGKVLTRLLALARRLGAAGARLLPYSPPSGAGPLPSRLAGRLAEASPDGYALTCADQGGTGCAAVRGEILFVGPDGRVKACPYAEKALGDAARGLAAYLRRPGGRPRHYPCQRPPRFC